MDKLQNPFPVISYEGPEYFCGRKEESSRLSDILKSGKNAAVLALRRMGKTGLLFHVSGELKSKKNDRVFYINLFGTESLAEMIKAFASATLGKLDLNHIKLMRELANYFSHLRPFIEYDKMSGASEIYFNLDVNFSAELTLEQIFTFLDRQPGQTTILIDEYQQIFEYAETNTEALISKGINSSKNLRFLIAASKNQEVNTALKNESSVLHSLEKVNLAAIDHETYSAFIIEKFAEAKRKITETVADQILDWARHHTYYVQLLCNRLYAKGIRQPDEWFVERLIAEILEEKNAVFYAYRTLLTKNQWLLLKAIAKEKGAKQVLGGPFIKRHDLGSTSSVQTALAALSDKELIFEEDGLVYVVDLLLARWLEQH